MTDIAPQISDLALVDLELAELQAAVPGLELTVGDHVRVTAYLLALIDRSQFPANRSGLGPVLAPLLARTEAEQDGIHAFYAATDPDRPMIARPAAREVGRDSYPPPPMTGLTPAQRWIRAGAVLVVLAVLGTGMWMIADRIDWTPEVTPVVQEVISEQGSAGGLARWLALVSEAVAQVLTGDGALRVLLMALPLGIAAWRMHRVASRRAILEPETTDQARQVTPVALPTSDWTGLLTHPATARALGRLRLRRAWTSRRIDVRRTTEAAARSGQRGLRLVAEVETRSVAHLVLIDRRHANDHLGELGDLLVARLRDAGVPLQAFDLLADPARVVPCGAKLSADVAVTASAALADHFRDDGLLVVAEAGRLLDRFGRRLAGWLAPFGDPGMIAVMTPRPRSSWGREERQLAGLGVAVFPLCARGCAEYVAYRAASLGGRPTPPPRMKSQHPAWTIADASAAIEEASGDPDAIDEAMFALQAALSPRAHSLLSVLAIFPVLVPELTLRLRLVLGKGADDDTAVLGELAALPAFRTGRLPFWLRKQLVAALSPTQARAARDMIASFHNDIGQAALAERSLTIATETDGILRFLASLPHRDAQRTAEDALFVRFMEARDFDKAGNFDDLAEEVTGNLRRQLTRAVQVQLVAAAVLGLVGAAVMWFAARGLVEAALTGLAAVGTVIEPVIGRESPLLRAMLVAASLALFGWVNTRPDVGGATGVPARLAGQRPPALLWLPFVPAGVLVFAELAMLSQDLGYGVRSADFGAGELVHVPHMVVGLFVLCVVLGQRRAVPFDPVVFAAQRTTGQLMGGIAALLGANGALVYGMDRWQLGYALLPFLAGLLWALLMLLAAVLLVTAQATLKGTALASLRSLLAVFPLGLVGVTGWSLFASTFSTDLGSNPVQTGALAWLLALLPLLFRAGLLNVAEWGGMTALCAGALVLGHVYPGDAAGSVAFVLGFMLAMLPAAAVFGLTGLTLRRNLDARQFWRRGAMLLVLVGGLSGGVAALGVAAGIAQTPPTTQLLPDSPACDPITDPKCPVPIDPTAQTELPPEVLEDVEIVFASQLSTLPVGLFTYLALYFVMVLALGQLLWLRRLALDSGRVPAWDEGRMRILLVLPFLLLLGIGMRLSDTTQISLLPLYPLAAAGLAWRFGYWGAVVALAGIVPMLGQSGIAVNTLFGGAGIGMALTVLILCRMVAERGFVGRLLALDTITPAQYGVAALLGLPIMGFAVPEIAMRFEAAPGLVFWLALFIVGLSRVRLERVMLFLAATSSASFGLGQLLPAATDDGFYAGFRRGDLAEALVIFGWSLVVLAIARALRRRFIADLGPDAAGHDGWLMAALTRVFDSRLVLLWVTAWTADILLKLQVGSQIIEPGILGFLFAFAFGMRLWDLDDRIRTLSGLLSIAVGALSLFALAVFVALDSRLVLSASGTVLEPESQLLGWQIFVVAYILFGYFVARQSSGLRISAVLEPGLWVPARPNELQEMPDVLRTA